MSRRKKKNKNRKIIIAISVLLVLFAVISLTIKFIKENNKPDEPEIPDDPIIIDNTAPLVSYDHLDPLYVKKEEKDQLNFAINIEYSDETSEKENIKVSLDDSNVDYDTPGIYVVSVCFEDEAGNVSKIDRTLCVYTLNVGSLTTYAYNKELDDMLNEIIAAHVTDDMTLEEKLRACYDYVASYKYKGDVLVDNYKEEYVYYASRIINTNKGACYAYAVVLETLFLKFNVPIIEVKAKTAQWDGGYDEHFWTMAQLNGVWYHFDPLLESCYLEYHFFKIKSNYTYNGISRWDKTLYPWE